MTSGFLASGDDFYVTRDTQLAVVETTNDIFNASLYGKLDPFAAFTWQRAVASTWFASSPAEWASLFAFQNSGTIDGVLRNTLPHSDFFIRALGVQAHTIATGLQ